jgi:hypothetical protein
MPVAVLPADLAGGPAVTSIVTATDYAVAHNASHAMTAFEWARVQQLLDVGEVRRRRRDDAHQVFVPRSSDRSAWWYVILHRDGDHWRIGTQMRAGARYVAKEKEAGLLLRPGGATVIEEGMGEIAAEERP